MSTHIEIKFTGLQPEQQELLIAQLAEAGYEGFEETENELKAFIPERSYDKAFLHELAFKYQLPYSEQIIPDQNWNAVWESNFAPVIVDDFLAIRADFHEPLKGVTYEILITPKMSFGTGHHATTHMMVQQMRQIDFTGKSVFDFGTGTGVLAILAEKLGAGQITAIDNDDWSIVNAGENIERNKCSKIRLGKADSLTGNMQYDIILANINKNVILDNFQSLVSHLQTKGILLVSGLLKEDERDIARQADQYALQLYEKLVRNDWICLVFNR